MVTKSYEKTASSDSRKIGRVITRILKEFLTKDPIQQLEIVRDHVGTKSKLYETLSDLIESMGLRSEGEEKDNWFYLRNNLTEELSRTQKELFASFLYLNVIQIYTDCMSSSIKKDNKLTRQDFDESLLKILKRDCFGEAKRRGPKVYWSEERRLDFLARYNRFMYVIKKARAKKRQLERNFRKNGMRTRIEEKARKAVIKEFGIPHEYEQSTFYRGSPKTVAFDWISNDLHLSEKIYYLFQVLKKAQKEWNNVEENENQILIDVCFGSGVTIYYVMEIEPRPYEVWKGKTYETYEEYQKADIKQLSRKKKKISPEKPRVFYIVLDNEQVGYGAPSMELRRNTGNIFVTYGDADKYPFTPQSNSL